MLKANTKKKKLLLMFLFGLPAFGLISWLILNSIKDRGNKEDAKQKQQAFNTKLPDANLKESGKNKLEIYMQAQKDSAKLKEQQEKDASEKRLFDPGPPENDEIFADEYTPPVKKNNPTYRSKNSIDQNEKKVSDRLDKLYAALNNTETNNIENQFKDPYNPATSDHEKNIAHLERLMQDIQRADTDSNPEMKQMETVLDKLLDIQYPERVKDRQLKNTREEQHTICAVSTAEDFGSPDSLTETNSFWGFENEHTTTDSNNATTIPVVVHDNQLLQDRSVIKLRLLSDIFINGVRIPKSNFIFGECNLGDQRLYIQFNSIAFNNTIYPVKLTAFDTDGNEGIYIPGAIGRDAAKSGINDAIQQMQLATLNPSIGAQAATAGIQTAQNLLSKKVKRIQFTVKAGHKLLLKMKGSN